MLPLLDSPTWLDGRPTPKEPSIDYRLGLREAIQRRIINCDNLPDSMDEWQNMARKRSQRSKGSKALGLIGPRHNQNSHDSHAYQNTGQRTNLTRHNEHVPMDVDATNITVPFKKLTDEEQAQYWAEGRCFRCRTQGHMARNCPKNTNSQNVLNRQNSNVREASVVSTTTLVTLPTPLPMSNVPPPPPSKLSYTQQIRALKAKMSDKECLLYLDACDMGEDFCSARL
jgi:hypothetical protein